MSILKRRLTNLWRRQTTTPPPQPWPCQFPDRIFVTIGEPTKISGTVLLPGRYAFRPLDPGTERTPVQIFNEDQTRLVATLPAVSDN
jgi:hypothetical protein